MACAILTLSGLEAFCLHVNPGLSLRSNRWAEISERLWRLVKSQTGLKLANAFGVFQFQIQLMYCETNS